MWDWYKEAVIYEIRVRSFCDANADGVGDFLGLRSKLDYLEDLGVTALWLLPFYPSPLRDDGYDISDYCDVHPDCGTLEDFESFVEAAHERGMRVVTELVLNHTSDQHPWFERARRAPRESPERQWYVWSDSADRLADVRVIFGDFESSNWAWDSLAGQFYFHRFFRTQPDLNYDHPPVRQAVFDIADFWLARGVDGMRLDAVPYLFKREGTSCESLPETHHFLRDLRSHLDARYQGRMLLAEANQWPAETARYFGEGDECHMAFNFPLMPRLYLALAENRHEPITDLLARMPPLPEGCQWANFLRNHDELTLEMVSEADRERMRQCYAPDRRHRINVGIRRRLAPLLQGDRRRIELLNTLLLTLPGTPVLYYGDEIGMGDNPYLPDRQGVRTPMHWSGERNAGFSAADPQRLELPVITSPAYHYAGCNVEAQADLNGSLLHGIRGLLGARRRHGALFGRGSCQLLDAADSGVLAYLRERDEQKALVLANLAGDPRLARLDLSTYAGWVPRDWRSQRQLPALGQSPWQVLLGPHEVFVWILESPGCQDPEGC
ncbi:MAG: maltose alpha-D-glucosyltransferase [Cyanobacteria bacterium REEB65]|nr:maltose alpha-D-glucosyltransferase [Cyanobacteria bacterium REEB65]